MDASVEIVTVDATNVAEQGFFCYKSKPKSVGYQKKMGWLDRRFAEGLRIKILHEGDRSVGFVEYIPGEYAWRAVNAEGYMVVHCMWVVGKGRGKGYGSRLLKECIEDARKAGKRGVAMVSSSQPWLASKELFVKNGFEAVGQAPPTFELLVKQFRSGPLPAFPDDWDERLGRYGPGLTVVYADQCPYIEDAVKWALRLAGERGVEGRTIRLESSQQVRDSAPSAYGIFSIVYDGKLVSYKYISSKKEREAFLELLDGA